MSVDPVARGLGARANTSAGISAAGGALRADLLTSTGAWVTAHAYALNEVAVESSVAYVCIIAHTSGTFATDLAAGKWAVYQGVTQEGLNGRFGKDLNEFNLPIRKKIHDIANGVSTPAQVCIATLLDSVGGYYQWAAFPWLRDTIGTAGYAGDPVSTLTGSSGITYATSGDVIVPAGTVPLPYDYSYWPTGQHYDIGVGGVVTITVGGGVFTGTDFAAFFANINGGGTCKVDLLDNSNVVQDSIAVFDTNSGGAAACGTAEFAYASTVAAQVVRKIRVTGLTGRCKLVSSKFIHKGISGVVWFGFNRGGLGLDQAALAPKAVWKGVVTSLLPDLAVWTARETVATVATYLGALVTDWLAAAPACGWQFNGCWPYGGPASPPSSDYGVNPPVATSWLEQEEVRKVAEQFGFPFKNLYNLIGVSTRKDDPTDVHLSSREASRFANSWLKDLLGDFWFNVGFTAKRIYTALGRMARFELSSTGDPNVLSALAMTCDTGNNDTVVAFVRKITFTSNKDTTPVPVGEIVGSSNPSWQWRAYASNLNSFSNPAAFDLGDGSWLVGINSSLFWKNWRVSSSLVKERAEPGISRALAGSGTPSKNLDSADTGYTTTSDYMPNESRPAYDVTTKTLRELLAPTGGGAARTALKPTVDATKGLGMPFYVFAPTDLNFTDVATYAVGEVKDAIDTSTKAWTRKMNVGGTLFTWTMGTGV